MRDWTQRADAVADKSLDKQLESIQTNYSASLDRSNGPDGPDDYEVMGRSIAAIAAIQALERKWREVAANIRKGVRTSLSGAKANMLTACADELSKVLDGKADGA